MRGFGIPADVLLGRLGLTPIRMSGMAQLEVRRILEEVGLVVLEVQADVIGGRSIDSFTYFATTTDVGPRGGSDSAIWPIWPIRSPMPRWVSATPAMTPSLPIPL